MKDNRPCPRCGASTHKHRNRHATRPAKNTCALTINQLEAIHAAYGYASHYGTVNRYGTKKDLSITSLSRAIGAVRVG